VALLSEEETSFTIISKNLEANQLTPIFQCENRRFFCAEKISIPPMKLAISTENAIFQHLDDDRIKNPCYSSSELTKRREFYEKDKEVDASIRFL
jgi:hypothetical protein